MDKLLCDTPGYLAYLLSGKADVGLVCYLAIVQICHPLPGKSVIWQISYLAYLLSGTYVICKSAFWNSCYMVNLDIWHTCYPATPSSGKYIILQTCTSVLRYLAKLLSGKSVIWHTCYGQQRHGLRGEFRAALRAAGRQGSACGAVGQRRTACWVAGRTLEPHGHGERVACGRGDPNNPCTLDLPPESP